MSEINSERSVSEIKGTNDARLRVSINWSRVPAGEEVKGTLRVAGADTTFPIDVRVFNPDDRAVGRDVDFIEDNRRVSIEAENASMLVPGKNANWEMVRGLGYNGTAVTISPTTAAPCATTAQIQEESPCLQYSVWVRTPGEWKVTVRALPTFSAVAGKGLRCAIAWDNEIPKVITLPVSSSTGPPELP